MLPKTKFNHHSKSASSYLVGMTYQYLCLYNSMIAYLMFMWSGSKTQTIPPHANTKSYWCCGMERSGLQDWFTGYYICEIMVVRWSGKHPLWLSYTISKNIQYITTVSSLVCNHGNHSVVKTTNLFLQWYVYLLMHFLSFALHLGMYIHLVNTTRFLFHCYRVKGLNSGCFAQSMTLQGFWRCFCTSNLMETYFYRWTDL